MKPSRIPLFPLDLVLFPGMPLPLHIFEPRYKLMIACCIQEPIVFCVVRARRDGMANVGCTAEVVKVVQRYADGRMDIITHGRDVCVVREVLDEEPYSEGIVEYPEESETNTPDTRVDDLVQAFQECHEIIFQQRLDLQEPIGSIQLSYRLASELPIDLDFKQELLESRSENARRQRLLGHLREWLPMLHRAEKVRKNAAGNGHAHN